MKLCLTCKPFPGILTLETGNVRDVIAPQHSIVYVRYRTSIVCYSLAMHCYGAAYTDNHRSTMVMKENFRVWWGKQALGAHVKSTSSMCGTVAEIRYHTATIPLQYYYYSGTISDLFDDLMASVGMPPLKKIVTQSQTQITMSTQGSADTNAEKLYSCHQYASKVIQNLNFLRQNTRFCDVAIVAGGNVMKSCHYCKVHRAVLSASSPYFQAMFTAGLLEDQKDTIELHTIAPHILNSIVEFIYSGEIHINQSIVQDLMVAADMLELKEVVVGCTDFLKQELHCSNAIGIYRFADGHNCEELASVAMDFIQSHFPQICNEEEFFELPKDLLTKFLSSEHLRVDTEFQVLNVFWLKIGVLE
uniref:BTB domain-containing protein n=1 Tax=Timema douglasi TaxID=61478 RepID=A0A7R8VTM1_TIMDO|nr:unnamed protein product [Timema douglasi]